MSDVTPRASTSASPASLSTAASEGPIERAFRLLQLVVAAEGTVGVRELGRRAGLPRSTASRLIGILENLGMVARTADGGVVPGSALATLDTERTAAPLLADQLRPLLVDLAQRFGENAALSVDDGDALLYVAQVNSANPVSAPDLSAERHAFHLVAPGLMTMAFWPKARIASALSQSGSPLEAATPQSVTTPQAIRRRLGQARSDGFVWTDQELDVGVNGFAVPVIGVDAECVATISLYGPSYRFSPTASPAVQHEVPRLVAAGASLARPVET